MTVPEPSDAWAWLALIRRPQGRKGEVFADILTDFPEKFTERRNLWLVAAAPSANAGAQVKSGAHSALSPALPAAVELIAHWPHKGGIVLHFAGVDSISAAEALAGLAVAIPQAERAPLAEDEAYIGDLIGCTLVDVAGIGVAGAEPVVIGQIEDVDSTAGPVAMLIVRSQQDEILIPFAKSYLRRIDLDARRVEMALPAGLVDINRPR
jgi:16S rRNA processing protein RimM